MTATERIRAWVRQQFAAKYVDRVVQDLIDVATGNRPGNGFETESLKRIFPEFPSEKGRGQEKAD